MISDEGKRNSRPCEPKSSAFITLHNMNETQSILNTSNSYAMLHGIFLGIWGILSLVFNVLSLTQEWMQLPVMLFTLSSPFFACWLTFRFRRVVAPCPTQNFSFTAGFLHTFFCGFYASLWVALFVYIYLRFLDGGYVFDLYEQLLNSPDFQQALRASGSSDMFESVGGVREMIKLMRELPPSSYASAFFIYSLLLAPFFSLIIGAVSSRKARPPRMDACQ